MNRAELIEYVAEEMEITKVDAGRFVEIFLHAIYTNVRREGVKISGLGTFSAVKRKARKGRNPRTGEEIRIPAKWAPVFKPGSALREAVKKR